MARELWADLHQGRLRAAVIEGRKLIALEVDLPDAPRAGARYVGKLLRVNTALHGGEVDLGQGQKAFLSLRRHKAEPGDLLEVEWIAPPTGEKDAVVRYISAEVDGAPRLLDAGPDALTRALAYAPGRVVVADIKLQRQLAARDVEAELHKAPPALFDLLDLEAQVTALTARVVPFEGGTLVFDSTEVGHVVDVNGTGNVQTLNRVALAEFARQIRLRNLGGIILLDLIGDKKKNAGVLEALRAAVADDPCKVEVFGMTKLGLVEITRARRGYPLAALL